jgi:hypothetical protein
MKTLLSAGVLTVFMVALHGCTKDPLKNLQGDENIIYITHHDNATAFNTFSTFGISDSVAVIENNQLSGKAITGFDQQLITAFIDNMQQFGYTLVDKNNNPDVVINISRVYNDYTGIINYSDYYGGYGGYYDPYYWGYPGYSYYFPAVYGVYTITDGGVQADMFDAKNAGTNNGLKLIWNGLIQGSGTFSSSLVTKNIKALFDQSGYMKVN